MANVKCDGIKATGYWKGWSCGANAMYCLDGANFCANHYAEFAHEKITMASLNGDSAIGQSIKL